MEDLKYLAPCYATEFLKMCPTASAEEKKDLMLLMQRHYTESAQILGIGRILEFAAPSINKIALINKIKNTNNNFYFFHQALRVFCANFPDLITEANMSKLIATPIDWWAFALFLEELRKIDNRKVQRFINQKFFDDSLDIGKFSHTTTNIIRHLKFLNVQLITATFVPTILKLDLTAQSYIEHALRILSGAKATDRNFAFKASLLDRILEQPFKSSKVCYLIRALSHTPELLSEQNINKFYQDLPPLCETPSVEYAWQNLITLRPELATQENFNQILKNHVDVGTLNDILRSFSHQYCKGLTSSLWGLLAHREHIINAARLIDYLKKYPLDLNAKIIEQLITLPNIETILSILEQFKVGKILKHLQPMDLAVILETPDQACAYLLALKEFLQCCPDLINHDIKGLIAQKLTNATLLVPVLTKTQEPLTAAWLKRLLTADEAVLEVVLSQIAEQGDHMPISEEVLEECWLIADSANLSELRSKRRLATAACYPIEKKAKETSSSQAPVIFAAYNSSSNVKKFSIL